MKTTIIQDGDRYLVICQPRDGEGARYTISCATLEQAGRVAFRESHY